MRITSPAFRASTEIPARFTCEGEDVSPPLAIELDDPAVKTLALIVEDPDAPDPSSPRRAPWVHWVLFNIPPTTTFLPEAMSAATLPAGARMGKNDWRRVGWGGPCPSVGEHRYVFSLYALDVDVKGLAEPTKQELLRAIAGHVRAQAQLIGTYRLHRASRMAATRT